MFVFVCVVFICEENQSELASALGLTLAANAAVSLRSSSM